MPYLYEIVDSLYSRTVSLFVSSPRITQASIPTGPTAMRKASLEDTPAGAPVVVLLAVVLMVPIFCPRLYDNPSAWRSTLFSEWEPPRTWHIDLLDSIVKARLVVACPVTAISDFRIKQGVFEGKVTVSGPVLQSDEKPSDLWTPPQPEGWRPCSFPTTNGPDEPGNAVGYVQVFLEGGLNQQRMGICDAVAVAALLNATLVLPHFDVNPFWKDSSSFADIFDVDHFIRSLKGVVRVVKELPERYSWSTREYYGTGFRATRVKTAPSLASPDWYITNVLPLLQSHGIVAIAPFSHRLAFDGIPYEIQRLRCWVNFEALQFVSTITSLGDAIVKRLHFSQSMPSEKVKWDSLSASGVQGQPFKYVALHLRFDKDMAAHSACDFGGGKAERLALAKYRQTMWQGRVKKSSFSAEHLREHGKCPLTPEEIGIALAALGFDSSTRVYLASHKVYGGKTRMSALRQLFPLLMDKKSLTTDEELRPFHGRASLSAALDYYVSLHSDVFISASPGNMHNALAGHRTFQNVQKTIRPDMKLLAGLFANTTISWSDFSQKVVLGHRYRIGHVRLRQPDQSIFTYPAPDCMCKDIS